MKHVLRLVATLVLVPALCYVGPAEALPRFAARNGMECVQCHVNPTGGGIRNSYGRSVFSHTWLPAVTGGQEEAWTVEDLDSLEKKDAGGGMFDGFSGEITEWLALGADLRAAYIWIKPDKGATEGAEPEITNSFFLMQADLYHAITVNEHLTLVLDVGIYSGFEAWALINFFPNADHDLYLKVGHFLPPFGVREVEHQLFTRQGVGFGAVDRDTGLEIGGLIGPFSFALSLTNGTLGGTAFDVSGKQETRVFEKAFASRLALRFDAGPLRAQFGASFYWNENMNAMNPLFSSSLAGSLLAQPGEGLDEIRAGAFLTASAGRFTYIGDFVYVRDDPVSPKLGSIEGYATYQELTVAIIQGLDLVLTYEFSEPDLSVANNTSQRLGVIFEVFPLPFMEVRAMTRRLWSDTSPTGGSWDVVLFLHLFL